MASQDLIIEYSSNPPNKGILDNATIRYREGNRVCADVVEVSLKIEDNSLCQFMFDGSVTIRRSTPAASMAARVADRRAANSSRENLRAGGMARPRIWIP